MKRRYGDVARNPSKGRGGRAYKGAIHYSIKRRTQDYQAYVCLMPGKARGALTARALFEKDPAANARADRTHQKRCGDGYGKTPSAALRDGMQELLHRMK